MEGRQADNVTDHAGRPLLFLDIDGTLLPFGRDLQSVPGAAVSGSYPTRLNPRAGLRLAALPCELVWATTWEDDANAEMAPRLGLPSLAVVNWPEPSPEGEREEQWFGLHWKTRTLVAWAAGRSFAWVDDEITDADRDWVSTHHHGRALLHRVDSAEALTEADFVALDAWLRAT
ncbi:MAG TPA: HAD domain-containing protein [Glycomyces sp.]|nr:HAD domain-containing protein [Glycomyces sp.]